MKEPKSTPIHGYQLRISLLGVEPQIWRQFLVPAHVALERLHDVLQSVMGWGEWGTDHHIFAAGNRRYGPPEDGTDMQDETSVCLWHLVSREGDRFIYIYDICDDWQHEIVVEKVHKAGMALRETVVCLDGAGACPPESCGGPEGYAVLLKVLSDPKHEQHDRALNWIGHNHDPNKFR